MDSFKGRCPHRSVPVEMDESMTSVSLERALPTCQQCTKHTSIQGMQDRGCEPKERADLFVDLWRLPEGHLHRQPRGAPEPHFPNTHSGQMGPSHSALVWPPDHRQPVLYYSTDSMVNHSRGYTGPPNWPEERSVEETESLECPLPLKSDVNSHPHISSRYPAAHTPGQCGGPVQGGGLRKCVCHIPADPPQNNYSYYQHNQDYPRNPRQTPQANQQLWNSPHNNRPFREAPNANRASVPQCVAPPREVMQEVSIESSFRADPGPVTRETRRTISLPEECRNVFITYSVDTARDMIPFTKFLTDQGFRPAIDIFDNPVRRMDTTKWMDRYLLDKSILIIVVISPKYKEDVEGDADDEHGLHTKYIHNQIKNDFILQGCLNFRLVPVLFPYATKTHVPKWLQSTRIYSWPRDTQDLLLRLLREERYIVPQPRGSLTLTVRPV